MSALRAALAAGRLAEKDSAWSMLRGINAPAAIAILGAHLAEGTHRMAAPVLFDAVDADLEDLRAAGFDLPQTGMQYCRDWLTAGYLVRRPAEAREEEYELSEGALVAIRFVEQLADPRPSVTESRLATIVERIHQLAIDTDPDVTRRIAALTAERDRIDAQIAALRAGDIEVMAEDRATERAIDILSMAAEVPEDFASAGRTRRRAPRTGADTVGRRAGRDPRRAEPRMSESVAEGTRLMVHGYAGQHG